MISAITAVFCVWWIVDRSKPRPQILPSYRSQAEGTVSFTLTNPTTVSYHYWVLHEFKTNRIWNIDPPVQVIHWEDRKELPPHQAINVTVSPHSRKWRVTARCVRTPSAPPTLTTRVRDFLNDWNLGWVATKLEIYDKGILVSGPEMPSEISLAKP
jgi:hypothetical protein